MLVRIVVAGALLVSVSPAYAHLELTSHLARYGAIQKAGPCGEAGGTRTTDKVYIAKPGIQVMLVWDETVNHTPSFFRIAFDDDGDDDFGTPHVDCPDPKNDFQACFDRTDSALGMVNDIEDNEADPNDQTQSYLYTLPDVECDNCTLQVIQVMGDKAPFETTPTNNDIYYQCIDLILSADGPDELTLIETDPPDAGPGNGGDDGGLGGPTDGGGTTSGGCQTAGGSGGAGLALLVLVALVIGRRRSR